MLSTDKTASRRKVSKATIRRSVASSTAIETGKSVKALEKKLRTKKSALRRITLAAGKTR